MDRDDSYIAMSNFDASGNQMSVDVAYEMTLKFKSENEDGLLFYISDDQQSQVSLWNEVKCTAYMGHLDMTIFPSQGVHIVRMLETFLTMFFFVLMHPVYCT